MPVADELNGRRYEGAVVHRGFSPSRPTPYFYTWRRRIGIRRLSDRDRRFWLNYRALKKETLQKIRKPAGAGALAACFPLRAGRRAPHVGFTCIIGSNTIPAHGIFLRRTCMLSSSVFCAESGGRAAGAGDGAKNGSPPGSLLLLPAGLLPIRHHLLIPPKSTCSGIFYLYHDEEALGRDSFCTRAADAAAAASYLFSYLPYAEGRLCIAYFCGDLRAGCGALPRSPFLQERKKERCCDTERRRFAAALGTGKWCWAAAWCWCGAATFDLPMLPIRSAEIMERSVRSSIAL